MESNFFAEIMAHILTLEDILSQVYGISMENINEATKIKKKSIENQMNKYFKERKEKDIETILTHEQFEQNSYKVGGKR